MPVVVRVREERRGENERKKERCMGVGMEWEERGSGIIMNVAKRNKTRTKQHSVHVAIH